MGRLGIAAVCLVLATPLIHAQKTSTPAQIASRRDQIQKAIEAYAGGDRSAAARMVGGRLDSVTKVALAELLGDRKALWNPARVAFTLEVAVALQHSRDGFALIDVYSLVRQAGLQVAARPAPIGSNAIEDRFEARWHEIALALFQSIGLWDVHDEYLAAISPRIVRMAQLTPPVPNRFVLMRAVNAAMRCCRSALASPFAGQVTIVVTSSGIARPDPPAASTDAAIALFDAAAAVPSLRVDALTRKAYLEQRVGRASKALLTLDRAVPVSDEAFAYAGSLIRAGALDELGRPDAAADAYTAALAIAPTAQVPAIGRAAALQRAGRTDDAVAAATQARQLPPGGVDPWPVFMRGDARFIDEWMIELRALLR